jgi:hypothetical protein
MSEREPQPSRWLWEELLRRLGRAAYDEVREGYLARQRQYSHDRRHLPTVRPKLPQQRKKMP